MSGVGIGPAGAPPRDDLPWLRRRRLRPDVPARQTSGAASAPAAATRTAASSAASSAGPTGGSSAAGGGTSLDLSGPAPTSGRSAAPAPAAPPASSAPRPAASSGTSLDLSAPAAAPAGGTSLDLSGPAAGAGGSSGAPLGVSPPARPSASSSGTSLDLSSPAGPTRHAGASSASGTSLDLPSAGRTSTPSSASGTSLDLPSAGRSASSSSGTSLDLSGSSAPSAAPSRPARPRPSAAAGDLVLGYTPDRLAPGGRASLTDDRPTLTLDRLQSGIGVLTVRAAVSEHIGDLRLAAAYRLTTGESSVLDEARGLAVAPPGTSRYVVVAARDSGDVLRVDLRQVRRLERLVVLAFSPSHATLRWGGALLVETSDGGRVDVALDREPASGVLVALSVTQVRGELVLRAEDELVHGTFRDAALAYGFTSITWVDPWTPLT